MQDILNQITKEAQRIAKIENKLFEVIKQPLVINNEDPAFLSPKEVYGTYKHTGGYPLGIVGSDYTPQQPKDLFNLFIDGIANNSNLTTDTLGYHEMAGGSKIRFTVPVGMVSFKNIIGQQDESVVTLNFKTGFDGKTMTSMYLSTYRLVCSNGMKKTFTEHTCRFKNTSGNAGKAVSLIEDIQRQLKQVESIEEMYLFLNSIKVNKKQTKKFVENVTGYDLTDTSDFSTRKLNIIEAINGSISTEFDRTGATAYGLLQGITHYTNHKASGYANPDFIHIANGQKINDKALKFALELAK